MAKGAATEEMLGALHNMLAAVFHRTLEKYIAALDTLESFDAEELDAQTKVEMLAAIPEPNPAMLSALAKFLKDSDIGMDAAVADALSNTQRSLLDKRSQRAAAGINLSSIPHVGEG